jgi:hypothetical protein
MNNRAHVSSLFRFLSTLFPDYQVKKRQLGQEQAVLSCALDKQAYLTLRPAFARL